MVLDPRQWPGGRGVVVSREGRSQGMGAERRRCCMTMDAKLRERWLAYVETDRAARAAPDVQREADRAIALTRLLARLAKLMEERDD